MEALFLKSVPFIKVLSSFGLMLVGIRFRFGIGLSILIGGFAWGSCSAWGRQSLSRPEPWPSCRKSFFSGRHCRADTRFV